MNDNATAWVAALRSGDYEQGRQQLRDGENSYCCLGVACNEYQKATGDGEWVWDSHAHAWIFCTGSRQQRFYLPQRVRQWLGLANLAGQTTAKRGSTWSLVSLNDGGRSFEEIANTVEARQEDLFA